MGVVLAGAAWVTLYAVLMRATRNSPDASRLVGEVVYLVPIAAATALAVYAARRTRQRVGTAWRLLIVSNSLWLIGESTWAVYSYLSPEGAPVPSFADAAYLLSYAVALPAIVIGLGLGVLGRTQGLLDALLVAAGAAAIGWQMLISPLVPSTWSAAALVTFLYPVFSVSIVSILVAVLLSGAQHVPRSMIIVGTAFGLASITDGAYAYLTAVDRYESSSWVNLGWQVEAVLLCVAAVVAGRRAESDQPRAVDPDLAFLPAVVAVLAVGGLAVADLVLVGRLSLVTLAVTMLLLLGLLVRQVVATRDRARLTQGLRTAAITDQLTGLYNRRFFKEMIDVEAERAVRHHLPLSLVLIDLDHFKDINDTYGHSVGDAVLTDVAQRLRREVRGSDLLCRYGGEEFVCLLPSTPAPAAYELAERLRQTLRGTPAAVAGVAEPVVLTASLGVATVEPGERGRVDTDALIDEADQAVYRAKALGRDRVVGSGQPSPTAADPVTDLPPALVWMADRIDRALGDRECAAAVSRWAFRTASRLGLDDATQRRTAAAARVHDIGRITALATQQPDRPLGGRRADDPGHPAQGARLLVELAARPDLAPLVAAHHENHDGTGFPYGLAGAEIPVEARIIAVCDAWAVLRADDSCPQEAPVPPGRDALVEGRGTRFDPAVLDAFLALLDDGALDDPAHYGDHPAAQPAAHAPVGADDTPRTVPR
ncbi:bifunctional diguanylate cyclase/phosphohydrolase [Catellatospora sichuanensis]|uniref:bifunctional diguanylate cyclase/phosphohydrolase n=1 Tax=Catellatospora sichuanensis TaxID=1969805 RepID=UPI0011843ED5|nr:diguanylate cyclase [Catellatospora sichuanensis]